MKWLDVLLTLLVFGIVVVFLYSQDAYGATLWDSTSHQVVSRANVEPSEDSAPCSGRYASIEVSRYGHINKACIHGNDHQMRMARFIQHGAYQYAVAFPGVSTFHEARGLCPLPLCAYASETDTLAVHYHYGYGNYNAAIFKDFSKSLIRKFDPSILGHYYEFTPNRPSDYTPKIGGNNVAVQAISFSPNGKWVVLEIKAFGFLRVNTTTFEARRVVAPGANYGLANDPRFEIALTNDGKYMFVSGWRAGTRLTAINEGCGDYLTENTSTYFASYIQPCVVISINSDIFGSNLSYVSLPKFNSRGDRLGFTAYYTTGLSERIVLGIKDGHPETRLNYLALGDSFTSGEGESEDIFYKPNSNTTPPKCHVSNRSYPYLVANTWRVYGQNIACSGARTIDILGGDNYFGQKGQLAHLSSSQQQSSKENAVGEFDTGVVPQLDFVSYYQPGVVSVSVGGNDAGLVGKLMACLAPTTCEWVGDSAKRYASMKEISEVYPKVQSVVREIKLHAPSSKVMLVGYPKIIDSHADALCDPTINALLDTSERAFINESILYLNRVLKAVASSEKVGFVDIGESLKGYTLCGHSGSKAMNGVRFGDDVAPINVLKDFYVFGAESFHPTPFGHQLIADTILQAYSTSEAALNCDECPSFSELLSPSSYWGEGRDSSQYTKQRESELTTKTILKPGETFQITAQTLSFISGAALTVELRSEPTLLGEAHALLDGSFEGNVTIPLATQPGYHVLHLKGTAPDTTLIDLYQTIAVVSEKALPVTNVPPSEIKQEAVSIQESEEQIAQHSRILAQLGQLNSLAVNKKQAAEVLGIKDQVALIKNSSTESSKDKTRQYNELLWATLSIVIIVIFTTIGIAVLKRRRRWRLKSSPDPD